MSIVDTQTTATGADRRRPRLLRQHWRFSTPDTPTVERHVILLDCSASMVTSGALAIAKGWLLIWLRRLRKQHVEVVLICFGGGRADRRFGPAIPTGWNESWIEPIRGGGGTPLALGVAEAIKQQGARHGANAPSLSRFFLLSDGRTLEHPTRPAGFQSLTVIDLEMQKVRLGRCAALASDWRADYLHRDSLGF